MRNDGTEATYDPLVLHTILSVSHTMRESLGFNELLPWSFLKLCRSGYHYGRPNRNHFEARESGVNLRQLLKSLQVSGLPTCFVSVNGVCLCSVSMHPQEWKVSISTVIVEVYIHWLTLQLPSSWASALDQVCTYLGVHDQPSRYQNFGLVQTREPLINNQVRLYAPVIVCLWWVGVIPVLEVAALHWHKCVELHVCTCTCILHGYLHTA